MNIARDRTEAQLRAAIAKAEAHCRQEMAWSLRCPDPKNRAWREREAGVQAEIAAEYRMALAQHLWLDRQLYHPMPEGVQ